MHVSESNDHIISHDPATYQAKTVAPVERPKKPVIILAVVGLLLVIVGGIWYFNGKSFDFTKEKPEEFALSSFDETVIATVGSEQIFANDLNYKLEQYPENMRESLKADFRKQLFEDSIILQAGADLDYIELSQDVFNSSTKNQIKRGQLIEQVKETVNKNASNIQGAYVTIWFMNYKPGPIGYDAGKELAFEKISALHKAVKAGTMTIKAAGQAIQNDASLAQVDQQYKTNAYVEFNSKEKPEGLTFQPEFDKELLALDVGETTAVFTGQDYEESNFSEESKDALYMFGQVTSRDTDGGPPFNQWLIQQKENYEVIEN